MKKSNSKKLGLALVATVVTLALLSVAVFAIFSDFEQGKVNGVNGTVDVGLSDVTLCNPNNINPGDSDPSNPSGARPGTPHDLDFTVNNKGNKSIVTQNTLIISVRDINGNLLDPSVYHIYDKANNNAELVVKSYVRDASNNIIAVKYVVAGKSFDGTGANAEIESGTDVKTGVAYTYHYTLGLDRGVDNRYQAAKVAIDIFVEAMQYRNTTNNDWSVIATKQVIAGGVTNTIVPNASQDRNGNNIY